jgi:hypothetical protein
MYSTVFWDVTPCSSAEVHQGFSPDYFWFLVFLFLDPKDGGDIILRNVAGPLPNHTAV